MSGSRELILGNIRKGLRRGALSGDALADCAERLAAPRPNLIPARAAALDHAGQLALFVQMASEAAALVHRVEAAAEVPALVAGIVDAAALPRQLVCAPAAAIAGLDWQGAGLQAQARAARQGDRVSVTPAFAGIAETGTLMLLSGAHSPTSLNFLPDLHIVVLSATRVLASYEEAFALWRRESAGEVPRTINLITGPSRSADIEQKLQMGAHGPIQLHIVLLGA
ncbi:LutC/YkgG family protein [Plasticicumulans acidivorans]|uniref:L-lactate dehydrogenase complex protein LldG n=1 Tax=Plasticicumulans acidivorans TaxID=886464 RepID=A0A317MWK4_9GAMM|nr:LUD domain-containing protein [Plasticicumulans acidivorans]PWV62463.1 L-lactate dehydrogenase complex protein LldG [Plasticicumulans acidivorans]